MSRVICFSIGALVLLATAHASSVAKGEEDNSGRGWAAATTVAPGWAAATTPGWGWGLPVVSGDNAAFGQTIIIENLAGNQTNSAPSTLEGVAADYYELGLYAASDQVSEILVSSGDLTPI